MFWRLYRTVLGALVLFAVLVGLTFGLMSDDEDRGDQRTEIFAKLVADALPANVSETTATQTLTRWQRDLGVDLALFDATGRRVAMAGAPVPAPDAEAITTAHERNRYWFRLQGRWVILLPLTQGSTLVSSLGGDGDKFGDRKKGVAAVFAVLALIGIAVAIAVYPMARRFARRFESLQNSVDAFGAGDLSARAAIRGKDDIARLASHFNRSADRIEALLTAQKSLLANASHELRSPLGRIRMAVTLLNEPDLDEAERRRAGAELQRNAGELDELVEELLTASRLDAGQVPGGPGTGQWESFDLAGLVAEECARTQISPDLISAEICGDRRLLRRLVRNLLENALRYGGADGAGDPAAQIAVQLQSVTGADGGVQINLSVCDRGPGVPTDELERIFEPFYRARGASEKAGGVGLGLSLVRQIAEHHDGRVRCEPRAGGGSCFQVYLPANPGGIREPTTTG